MGQLTTSAYMMSIAERIVALRREHSLTQQEMADRIGMHVNQVRRYEYGQSQPSLEALKKIAIAMSTSIDYLVFENDERDPADDLRLQFEAVSRLKPQHRDVIKELIEGMIIKYEAEKWRSV